MLVSEAVGATLAALGADTVFGVVGSGNFHVTNALIANGARFVAARHECGAACAADAWARGTGRTGHPDRAPGPGADQRADRHHRGGQEPHAAAGARRGRRERRGAVQLPHRRGGAGHLGRCGGGPAALPRHGRRRRGPCLPDRAAGAAHRGARDAAGRAGGAVRPAGCSRGAAAGSAGSRAGGGGQARRGAHRGRAPGVRGGPRRPGGPGRPGRGSRTPAARCSPRRRWPRGCSTTARGTWG